MRTRTIAAGPVVAGLLTASGCSSYSAEECRRAITGESTKASREHHRLSKGTGVLRVFAWGARHTCRICRSSGVGQNPVGLTACSAYVGCTTSYAPSRCAGRGYFLG